MLQDHIRWRRLDPITPRKVRKGFGGSPPLRLAVKHGADLAGRTAESIEQLRQKRRALGVDPSKLMVLKLGFLDSSERDLLEQTLNLHIVSEREIKLPLAESYYACHLKFEKPFDRRAVVAAVIARHPAAKLQDCRASDGNSDTKHLNVCFSIRETAKAFFVDTELGQALGFAVTGTSPTKQSSKTTTELLVQFPDEASIGQFLRQLDEYRTQVTTKDLLTNIQRHALFDALNSVTALSADDRKGGRLQSEGAPVGMFHIDVDLWHPGSPLLVAEVIKQFDVIVQATGGTVTDRPHSVAGTLLLARVRGDLATLERLLDYDGAALVDLPPKIRELEFSVLDDIRLPDTLNDLPEASALACVVDSGVMAGHPLISGTVVEERDFDSGEGTPVDRAGHGTHVAGIVVFGDVHQCMQSGDWTRKVRLLSAKIMHRAADGSAEFADDKRIETQVREAITHYSSTRDCRIFNLSFGLPSRPFRGGRQLPLAVQLDELARELDVVIVVSAGNVPNPEIPGATTVPEFQRAILEQLFTGDHTLIDPACAVNVLSVGSIARRDEVPSAIAGRRPQVVASPKLCPSPFTRVGLLDGGSGASRAIKPDLVGYGGNFSLDDFGGTQWQKRLVELAEPSLRHDYQGQRLLSVDSGTSYSAPFVTHVCALVESQLRQAGLVARPSANLIRALTVHSASASPEAIEWIGDGLEGEKRRLRAMGYGMPNQMKASWSADNRAVLFAEDQLQEEFFHLYELDVPPEFLTNPGRREIKITLAFDPPVRGTRKEYLSRSMWFKVYKGLRADAIFTAMSRAQGTGVQPKIATKHEFKARPTETALQWSTVQSATFESPHAKSFGSALVESGEPLVHILVGCASNFTGDPDELQRYALVCSLEHDNEQVKLYQTVRLKLTQRIRLQAGV